MKTSHGHHIPGTSSDGDPQIPVARCGGPKMCAKCAIEATQALKPEPEQTNSDSESLKYFIDMYFSTIEMMSHRFKNTDKEILKNLEDDAKAETARFVLRVKRDEEVEKILTLWDSGVVGIDQMMKVIDLYKPKEL